MENKNGITELVFVLDKSGSMHGFESDTIGGFNAMLEKQKAEEGKVYVTTVLFSNRLQVLHDRVDIKTIEPMRDFPVDGQTALLDALGETIHNISRIHKYARPEDVPEHTVFVIITDGMENASRNYTADEVRRMIRHEEEKYGWEFIFLAANIDAVGVAQRYGIRSDRAGNYRPCAQGMSDMYDCVAEAVVNIRKSKPLASNWKAKMEGDNR